MVVASADSDPVQFVLTLDKLLVSVDRIKKEEDLNSVCTFLCMTCILSFNPPHGYYTFPLTTESHK